MGRGNVNVVDGWNVGAVKGGSGPGPLCMRIGGHRSNQTQATGFVGKDLYKKCPPLELLVKPFSYRFVLLKCCWCANGSRENVHVCSMFVSPTRPA